MAVEAFVWSYQHGEPASFKFADVLDAFGEALVRWEPASGRLLLDFGGPAETCEVFVDPDAAASGRVRGLLISRPVQADALWHAVLRLLSDYQGLLFFSDDTTPFFWDLEAVRHYPGDLIASLGTPVCVRRPEDVRARKRGG